MFELKLDEASQGRLWALTNAQVNWHDHMGITLAQDLAKAAEEYMKPLMHVRPNYTGKLEESLTHEIEVTGSDWTVKFMGLDYGNWVDVGQDYDVLYASQYGLKYFPVDKRFGASIHATKIHAIGKSPNSPYDTPLKFSEKTADWLASAEASKIMEEHMNSFLDSVVI